MTAEPLVRKRKKLVLPLDVQAAFFGLHDKSDRSAYILVLRMAGWTLQSIADTLEVTRERVRQVESQQMRTVGLSRSMARVKELALAVPAPPVEELPPPKPKHIQVEPDPATLARLKDLLPLAQKVRGRSTKYRAEAEEFTALLNKAVTEEGCSYYHLAQLLEVNHQALISRMVRYGYKTTTGTSNSYQRINRANRVSIPFDMV